MRNTQQTTEKISIRRSVEVVSLLLIIFLSIYFLFGFGLQDFGSVSIISALSFVYLVVYYWQRRISKKIAQDIED